MPRLITFDDHPPEIEVVYAQSPGEFLTIANELLPKDDSPLQGIVWARDEAQDGSQTTPLLSVVDNFNQIGCVQYGEGIESFLSYCDKNSDRMMKAVIESNYPLENFQETSFLFNLLLAARNEMPNVILTTFVGVSDGVASPHFDSKKNKESNSKNSLFQKIFNKEDPQHSSHTFMNGHSFRVLYTDVGKNPEEKTGTLIWSPEELDCKKFNEAVQSGDLKRAQNIAERKYEIFSFDNAWQFRNADVIIFPDGKDWSAAKYPLHAGFPKVNRTNTDYRVLHRIDMMPN